MTTPGATLRFRLAHALVARQLTLDEYGRLVGMLDAGRPVRVVEAAMKEATRA